MTPTNLSQLVKKYGKKKSYKDEAFLFKTGDNDTNIYYIQDGGVSLQQGGNDLFILGAGQILGERTFITGDPKPIDAKVVGNSTVYIIEKKSFEKFELEVQKEFFSSLVVYLSERVNSLDSILGLLAGFNETIIDVKNTPNEKLLYFINHFFEVKSYIIMKYKDESFNLLYGDMQFDADLEKFLTDLINLKVEVKFGKNYLFVCRGNYVFLFEGQQKMDEYISGNVIYYVRALVQFLGETMETTRNDDLQKMCNI